MAKDYSLAYVVGTKLFRSNKAGLRTKTLKTFCYENDVLKPISIHQQTSIKETLNFSLSLQEKMSTATLRIIKFEDGFNFKTLCIAIPKDDDSSNIVFGEWTDSRIPPIDEREKSSRLIVKIVSGEEQSRINLDSCFKDISEENVFTTTSNKNTPVSLVDARSQADTTNNTLLPSEPYQINFEPMPQNLTLQFSNPLEHSLQIVKKNNALIMENINMLNRTLTYTKNKEILDIVCPKSLRTFPCNLCGKCFVYETGLRRHYIMRHAANELPPRWQLVWTCIQCFQVWPRQDQAHQHSIECCKNVPDNQDCVREIKTSLLLQCEFCEKVFTSIPRLLRHSKVHTTASNYECNSCGLVFASYKTAEQHWLVCPWMVANYGFSLPKMLLCNACDRKFRSYEQLYIHRYKVGHFMTKTHSSIGSVKTLGMLVYQCELCAQWYNSIPLIITHRSQHHTLNEHNTMYNNMETTIDNSEKYFLSSENGYHSMN